MFFFWGWGRKSITRQLDANNAVIRTYRYAHIFFIFRAAFGGEYALATMTEAGWARRPINKEEAQALLNGQKLQPTFWQRFGLAIALVVVAIIVIASSVAKSNTQLKGHAGSQQAWTDYLTGTKGTIDQLNALGKKPLTPAVRASTISLLTTLENSPDSTLNSAIANAVDTCTKRPKQCNAAVDNAGRAYNNALDEAGREGLVNVIPAH